MECRVGLGTRDGSTVYPISHYKHGEALISVKLLFVIVLTIDMLIRTLDASKHHTIFFPVPNMVYTTHPNIQTRAVWLNTAPQLFVASNMCPAMYTPTKPEEENCNSFVMKNENKILAQLNIRRFVHFEELIGIRWLHIHTKLKLITKIYTIKLKKCFLITST